MRFLQTAFGQLAFAWKLYHYGLDGQIDAEALDQDITFEDGPMVFVVPKALGPGDDLIIALQNNLTIAHGAAAITLNKVREELNLPLPNPIDTEQDQGIALIYQIRNAFAHDIAEPRWVMCPRYERRYDVGGVPVDLAGLNGQPFRYEHLGGPDALFRLKDWFVATIVEQAAQPNVALAR